MRIAILTSGILPVPAVRGGAVENHIGFYLKYNNEHRLHDMTVYSVADEKTEGHSLLNSDVNHFVFIDVKSLWAKIKKHLYKKLFGEKYYHYTIEYYFREAWKRIKKEHYDVILLENRPGYALSMDIPKGTQLFVYLHNDHLNKDVKGAKEIYEKTDRILTVSDYIAGCVRSINPSDTKSIPVLNGIDLNAFSPSITPKLSRQALGFSDNDFIMVFSGRITPVKGVRELIESIKALNNYPDIKLLVIGNPFFGNAADEDDYVRKLKQLAEPVKERIRFTGFVPYDEIPQYLRISDIAVIPSLWDDPCPNTVLEAQAMGLPTITTRRGGIPEEVTEEGAFLLATDEHFQDNLTAAILDLYEHPDKRQCMSVNQLNHSTYYSEQRYAEDVLRAIGKPFDE